MDPAAESGAGGHDALLVRPKCLFIALISGWAVAIFLPSALIAILGLSPLAEGRSFPAATLAVADEVAPLAKIGFMLLLAPAMIAARRYLRVRRAIAAAYALLAVAAMLATLALIPAEYSRGFGIGLGGARFSPGPLAIYLVGAVAAGLTAALAEARCIARNHPRP
ncbi:MAG TPA: hypothetical protein VIT45_00585 [Allosphingosinicella sp.]